MILAIPATPPPGRYLFCQRRRSRNAAQGLGGVLLYQERLKGEQLVREGIAIYQASGERVCIAEGVYIAGMGLMSFGEFTEAHAFLAEGVALYDELGICPPLARMMLGSANVHLGQYAQGGACGQAVYDATHELDRATVGFSLILLGWVALAWDNSNANTT